MATSVGIASDETIVLEWFYSDYSVEIATLEIWVEFNLLLVATQWAMIEVWPIWNVFFAYLFDGLGNGIDFYFIFLSIFPPITVTFVQLDRINMSRTSINYLKTRISFHFLNDWVDKNILVG